MPYYIDLIRTALHTIFLLLTIVSSINQWSNALIVTFFLLFVTCIIAAIAKPLFSRERLSALDWFEVGYHFFTLLVYAVVESFFFKELFDENVTQIICVVVGGLMTLYGVAITIKFNNWSELDKERNSAKPHVFPTSNETWGKINIEQIKVKTILEIFTDLETVDKRNEHFIFSDLHLYNSDASTCFVKGFIINNKHFIFFKYDEVLIKDSFNCLVVNFQFRLEKIERIQIVIGDTLDNNYLCASSWSIADNKRKKSKVIEIHGFLDTKLRTDIDCNYILDDYFNKKTKEKKKKRKI